MLNLIVYLRVFAAVVIAQTSTVPHTAELQSSEVDSIDSFEPSIEIVNPVSIESNTVTISSEDYFGYNYFRKDKGV